MKSFLRSILFNLFGLWLTSQILPGLIIVGDWKTILGGGIVLSLLMLLVKPILKILFIPINFLTFGLLSWFVNVIVFYLLTVFVPQIIIKSWTFTGVNLQGFVIPAINISYFFSLILTALIVSLFVNLLEELSES